MKIAVTGGRGRIGRGITEGALARGHSVVNIDRIDPVEAPAEGEVRPPLPVGDVRYVTADVGDYDDLLAAFEGCDAVDSHGGDPLAFPPSGPCRSQQQRRRQLQRAAGRRRARHHAICQASSVNAIGLSFSRAAHFDYFPIDEKHPPHNEEPYGLSKWICELQADSFARRYEGHPHRQHAVPPGGADRAVAVEHSSRRTVEHAKHLWAYTRLDAAADACLLSLDAGFTGHEVFYIVGPDTTMTTPTLELASRFFPNVPVRGDLSGTRSFFTAAKAERMLGWKHPAP